MSQRYSLGVLDFCHLHEGVSPADILWETLDLAPLAESFGYTRYWLAEHHTPRMAHSTPEMLLPILAGVTKKIRVGTAGVLLNMYSPFKVASSFRLLHTIFPRRIDLGLARGGVNEVIEQLLTGGAPPVPYDQKVRELLAFLRGTGETAVNPRGIAPPEVWVLGTKTTSMELAADNGAAFCLALFLNERHQGLESILAEYQDRFRPSPELPEPKWSVTFAGVCAETEAEARRIAEEKLPSVVPTVVGTPEQCREAVEEMREKYGTAEMVFLDLSRAFDDRVRSYRLLAEALELGAGPGAPVPARSEEVAVSG